MVVNNWFVTVNMYSSVTGNALWVRFFFVTIWIVIVLIQMNILIAIVLEIYGSVTDQVKEKFKEQKTRADLKDYFKDCSNDDEIRRKIDEAREIIEREERKLMKKSMEAG